MKLPVYYLPPIEWFRDYLMNEDVVLDTEEIFQKQTLRNHCMIDSPQGALKLTVPIEKVVGRTAMKDVRISNHGDWKHKHWHAIETSYYNSPYFEYLQDDFRRVYDKNTKFLLDFNLELINVCMDLLEIPNSKFKIQNSKLIAPKPSDERDTPPAMEVYYQVFDYKHGFLPGLSIIDLLFNMGKEALLVMASKPYHSHITDLTKT